MGREPELRQLKVGATGTTIEIKAKTITFFHSGLSLQEGDSITIDGATGKIYLGIQTIEESPIRKTYEILAAILDEAVQKFGPNKAWTRYTELPIYRENKTMLQQFVSSSIFQQFNDSLLLARKSAKLQIRATVHTTNGALKGRLLDCDINLNPVGDVVIKQNNCFTGIGLLRTERLFRRQEELDALRLLLLDEKISCVRTKENATNCVLNFQRDSLKNMLMVNSGLPTVVRTLCMPFNKLFPTNDGLEILIRNHNLDKDSIQRYVSEMLRESDTFHGCRGARLHVIRPDLAKLEIRAILEAMIAVLQNHGSVDLTILVSMVTFAEELQFYANLVDEVYTTLPTQSIKLPKIKLATMIETTAAFLNIERFAAISSRHTEFVGVLFGGNDFTAASLNLNRNDAPRIIIPNFQRKGIIDQDPFCSLHTDTVGRAIQTGLSRLKRVIKSNAPVFGFGGEQAGDTQTVQWLSQHAVPSGLTYITTNPDRMIEVQLTAKG